MAIGFFDIFNFQYYDFMLLLRCKRGKNMKHDGFICSGIEPHEWEFFEALDDEYGLGSLFKYWVKGSKTTYRKNGKDLDVSFSFSGESGKGFDFILGDKESSDCIRSFLRLCCEDVGVSMPKNIAMFRTPELPIDTWKEEYKTLVGLSI